MLWFKKHGRLLITSIYLSWFSIRLKTFTKIVPSSASCLEKDKIEGRIFGRLLCFLYTFLPDACYMLHVLVL